MRRSKSKSGGIKLDHPARIISDIILPYVTYKSDTAVSKKKAIRSFLRADQFFSNLKKKNIITKENVEEKCDWALATQKMAYARAAGLLEKAIEESPDDADLHAILACALEHAYGKYPVKDLHEKQLRYAERAYNLNPEKSSLKLLLAYVVAKGCYTKTVKEKLQELRPKTLFLLDEIIARDPRAYLYHLKGVILRFLNRQEEAILAFQEAIKADEKNSASLYQLAEIYDEIGDKEKALQYYLQRYKTDTDRWYSGYHEYDIAQRCIELKRFEEAIPFIRKSIKYCRKSFKRSLECTDLLPGEIECHTKHLKEMEGALKHCLSQVNPD